VLIIALDWYYLDCSGTDCKRESVLSADGILLEERANSPVNPVLQKIISDTSNKIESLFVQAKNSLDAMQILRDGVFALGGQNKRYDSSQRTK